MSHCDVFLQVALIRMTSDGRLPAAERRNYKHVGDAIVRMAREEGLTTLWRGAIPTMGRAMVVNAAQLASYSQAKQALLTTGGFFSFSALFPWLCVMIWLFTGLFGDNVYLHFWASMFSGLVTTAASMPVDIAKTRRVHYPQ